jgi:DNA-binding CsgD family transcriptional regulator
LADALACVGQLDVGDRHFDRAAPLLREALEVAIALGDQRMIARCLERLAYLAAAQGQSGRALRLASGADALRTASRLPRAPVESHTLNRWLEPAVHGLEPDKQQQVSREGATMNSERLLAYALEATETNRGRVDADSGVSDVAIVSQLSPREQEVALLVARGLSNPRIATELIIGDRTVQTHVSNILAKLGLSSRVQIAGWVAEHHAAAATRHDP